MGSLDPCDKCRDYMEQGILLISVDPKRTQDRHNPYRTGGWVVIKEATTSSPPTRRS